MSTTFGVLVNNKEVSIARRVGGVDGATIHFTNELAEALPNDTPVIPLDNTAQGIFTIGDIRNHLAFGDENRDALDREIADLPNDYIKSIKVKPIIDETDYLTSSKANKEHLDKAIKEMGKGSDINPKALLSLGFEEVYQSPDMGEAGYIYYALNLYGIELLSTASDEGELKVVLGDDTEINELSKLQSLVTSLKLL
jgi:hypothetical protein|tara:strand:+ start:6734 stop:7324 length:591 start_codon:yes stop_codon:yes gene_type:complete